MKILIAIIVLVLLVNSCKKDAAVQNDHAGFRMVVQDVFYIEGIERVIVTGVVADGVVRVGDKLVVKTASDETTVTVEKLEHPHQILAEARTGQDVGLMLVGIRRGKVTRGDEVVSAAADANQ